MFNAIYRITAFALPVCAGGIINMVSNFISMMMVAQLGKKQLAASALAVSTFITIMTVVATMMYAVGILISHHRGKESSQAEIGLIVKNGFWLAILLALPAALCLWHIDKLLLFFGQETELVALTKGYFHFAAFGMFPLLVITVISQFYSGTGNPRFTMLIAMLSLPLTLLTSYGFILGHFNLPKLGLAGITCASLITQSTMALAIFIILYLRNNIQSYRLFNRPFLPSWSVCKLILTLGMPIGVQFGGEIAAMTIATYLLGYFGVTALASSQIVSQYFMIVLMLTLGLTQALSMLISEAYGKHDIQLIKKYLHASIFILVIYCTSISILFVGFPMQLIRFYVNKNIMDATLIHLTTLFFIISSVGLFVDGIRHLLSGALRGLHDSQAPMRIGIIAMWCISLPISYLIGFTFNGGPIGIRAGFLSGFAFAAILLWLRIRKKLNYR